MPAGARPHSVLRQVPEPDWNLVSRYLRGNLRACGKRAIMGRSQNCLATAVIGDLKRHVTSQSHIYAILKKPFGKTIFDREVVAGLCVFAPFCRMCFECADQRSVPGVIGAQPRGRPNLKLMRPEAQAKIVALIWIVFSSWSIEPI